MYLHSFYIISDVSMHRIESGEGEKIMGGSANKVKVGLLNEMNMAAM